MARRMLASDHNLDLAGPAGAAVEETVLRTDVTIPQSHVQLPQRQPRPKNATRHRSACQHAEVGRKQRLHRPSTLREIELKRGKRLTAREEGGVRGEAATAPARLEGRCRVEEGVPREEGDREAELRENKEHTLQTLHTL